MSTAIRDDVKHTFDLKGNITFVCAHTVCATSFFRAGLYDVKNVHVKFEDKMASRTKKGRFLSSKENYRHEACKTIGGLRKKEENVESASLIKTYDNSDGNRIVNVGEVTVRQLLEGCYDCGNELRLLCLRGLLEGGFSRITTL